MNYINGLWSQGAGERFHSLNPSNQEILWSGNASTPDDIELAIKAAKNAFESWRSLGISKRIECLAKYRSLLERDKSYLAQLVSDETGKPRWECLTEVGAMIGKLQISINAYEERCAEKVSPLGDDCKSVTRFKPIGPMAVFGPFNLPLHLPNGHIIPALIAGNTIVFKPSEETPHSAQRMVELFEEASLPNGVINLVQGGKETGIALTNNKFLKGILFTGSYPTGKAIHKALAGRPEVMLALEMGGNNPLIVWDCSDIQAAAYSIIQSAFITAGQRCVCARRLILPEGQFGDSIIAELLEQTKALKVGLPSDDDEPFVGPLISSTAAQLALTEQQNLYDSGGIEILKMQQSDRSPALLSPGIVDVTTVGKRTDEEIFAPILQVIRVKDYDAALAEAENTEYGLSAGLISDSEKLYSRLLNYSTAGIINWNRQVTGASSAAPFGGSGKSGNFRPSAYFAADYCATPVASLEMPILNLPDTLPTGVTIHPNE